jgi:hypothetical protein
MKKYAVQLSISAFLILVTIGVFSLLRFGYEPAPVLVMSPSQFDSPEQIGVVMLRRFYSPVAQKQLIAFGVPPRPDWHREILMGFLKAAQADKVPFEVIIAEEQMPALNLSNLPPIAVVSVPTNTPTLSELVDAVNQNRGKRVLLYLPSIFSSHVFAVNTMSRLEQMLQVHVLSISTAPLALRPDQEYRIDPPCLGSERDHNGTSDFGCQVLKAGRMYYRKKVNQTRWVAISNMPRPEDYLLMVSEPGQDKGNDAGNAKLRNNPPKPPQLPPGD